MMATLPVTMYKNQFHSYTPTINSKKCNFLKHDLRDFVINVTKDEQDLHAKV